MEPLEVLDTLGAMKLALLRAAYRHPLVAAGLAIVALTGSVALGVHAFSSEAEPQGTEDLSHDVAGKNPRLLLGRLWLDKMPRRPTDNVDLWIFFGGGIGVHETGSRWDGRYEIFELERRGSVVDLTYLQTKKKVTTKFDIESCDDLDPFDLCLTLKDMPGGPLRLHGFDYGDDMDRAMPWGRATVESAKAKTNAPRY